mgnify:CR=1 FL=1
MKTIFIMHDLISGEKPCLKGVNAFPKGSFGFLGLKTLVLQL